MDSDLRVRATAARLVPVRQLRTDAGTTSSETRPARTVSHRRESVPMTRTICPWGLSARYCALWHPCGHAGRRRNGGEK
jgi:hypothetical protein